MSDVIFLDLLGPLKIAFYERLVGDAQLVALLATEDAGRQFEGVYDGAPEGAPYPYIDIGEAIETPRNTLAEPGAEAVQDLHVWSKERGYLDGLKIVGRLRALLDHQQLVVAGHHLVSIHHEMTQTLRDPDPEIRHLPVRFRITTEQE